VPERAALRIPALLLDLRPAEWNKRKASDAGMHTVKSIPRIDFSDGDHPHICNRDLRNTFSKPAAFTSEFSEF